MAAGDAKAKQHAGDSEIQSKIREEAAALLAKSKGLSQRVATYCNRLVGESDSLAVEIKSLQEAIKAAEKAARSALSSSAAATGRGSSTGGAAAAGGATTTGAVAGDVLADLKAAKSVLQGLGPGGDLRKFCKPRNPFLLRHLLGDKVSVVAYRSDQSIAMKEEYHRFRDRCAWVMLLVPLLLVLGMRRADAVKEEGGTTTFTPGIMTGVQMYFLWLGYFYLAMALRENVLLVNGSAIKAWWIQHHYWSAACTLTLLGLPVYSPAVYMFCEYFLMWSCFQALVMMMQNHYQRRRMYTRIALGKSSAMDVVAGESSGASGQLLLLYPLLILLQVSQFAIGAGIALRTYPALLAQEGWLDVESLGSDLRGMRGVCVVGVAFCFMAVRNFLTTVQTISDKRKYASQAKRAGRAAKSS